MKILKTEDIKTAVVTWLKTIYTDCTIEANWHYISIDRKDIGKVDFTILKRRKIRIRGATDYSLVGGGVMLGGRRDNSIIIHGGAKSDFGVFDEVEFQRRIDYKFNKKIADKEASKKAEQVYKERCAVLDPIFVTYGFKTNISYSWLKTWEYDSKIRVSLSTGGKLTMEILNNNIIEEEVLKLAKGLKEILSGELTSNSI